MKTLPVRWLAIAAIVLNALWLGSCGKDSTTCPRYSCPNPERALYGLWMTFEATYNGSPTTMYDGMEFRFSDNDTMLVIHTTPPPGNTLRYLWSANDSTVFFESTPSYGDILIMGYKITKDTLDLWDRMPTADLTLRMLRTP
jgi:hypothetical protein